MAYKSERLTLAVVLITRVMAVLSFFLVLVFAQSTYTYAHCQARLNAVVIERTRVLASAADAERAATREADSAEAAFLLSPLVSKPVEQRTEADKAELTRLYVAWQTALHHKGAAQNTADKERAAHPVPAAPTNLCG
jgi:hypothetical protein